MQVFSTFSLGRLDTTLLPVLAHQKVYQFGSMSTDVRRCLMFHIFKISNLFMYHWTVFILLGCLCVIIIITPITNIILTTTSSSSIVVVVIIRLTYNFCHRLFMEILIASYWDHPKILTLHRRCSMRKLLVPMTTRGQSRLYSVHSVGKWAQVVSSVEWWHCQALPWYSHWRSTLCLVRCIGPTITAESHVLAVPHSCTESRVVGKLNIRGVLEFSNKLSAVPSLGYKFTLLMALNWVASFVCDC